MTPKREKQRQDALSEAYHDYSKKLVSHAFFKLHDRDMSDDLVQDTFLKTWKYLAKEGKIDVMKSFLFHILNNLIIDEYRKRKNVSLDVLLEKGYEPGVDNRERLIDALDGKAAVLLIARLPAQYRKIMRMRYIDDLTLADISAITGKSKNAIAVQLHRGLTKLKTIYNHE